MRRGHTDNHEKVAQAFQPVRGHPSDYLYEPSRLLARAYRLSLAMRPTGGFTARRQGKKARDGDNMERPSLRTRCTELRALLRLMWRQGIRADYRLQFCTQLVGILRHNSSRIRKYLDSCGMGEDLFGLREIILQKAAHRAAIVAESGPSSAVPGSHTKLQSNHHLL